MNPETEALSGINGARKDAHRLAIGLVCAATASLLLAWGVSREMAAALALMIAANGVMWYLAMRMFLRISVAFSDMSEVLNLIVRAEIERQSRRAEDGSSSS